MNNCINLRYSLISVLKVFWVINNVLGHLLCFLCHNSVFFKVFLAHDHHPAPDNNIIKINALSCVS